MNHEKIVKGFETDINQLEKITRRLEDYLLDYLDSNVPYFKKYHYVRVKTIELMTNSLTKVMEMLLKCRKEVIDLQSQNQEQDQFWTLLQDVTKNEKVFPEVGSKDNIFNFDLKDEEN